MTPPETSPPQRGQAGIMLTLALSMLLASLGTSVANIALPALAEAFSAPFAQVQAVVVSYLAALTASVVFIGWLGDAHGLRTLYLTGLALFAVASLLCGIAPTLGLLIGARVLQGIGAAFLMTLSMALMRETAGEDRLGRAMGLLGTVSALGTALGPSLGGLLVLAAGWRGVFWAQVPLTTLTLALAFRALPRRTPRESSPATRPWVLPDRRLLPGLVVNLMVAAVMMATLVVGPFYLGRGLGLSDALVGLVMSVGPGVAIFSGVPAGRLVDAWGSRRVLALGLILLTIGTFLLATLPIIVGVSGYILAIMVLTPGYQLFQAANNTATLADVPPDQRGTVAGLLALSRNIGLIAGASLMGSVFALGVGSDDLAHAAPMAITTGMRLTFMLAGGLMILAIAATHGQGILRSLAQEKVR